MAAGPGLETLCVSVLSETVPSVPDTGQGLSSSAGLMLRHEQHLSSLLSTAYLVPILLFHQGSQRHTSQPHCCSPGHPEPGPLGNGGFRGSTCSQGSLYLLLVPRASLYPGGSKTRIPPDKANPSVIWLNIKTCRFYNIRFLEATSNQARRSLLGLGYKLKFLKISRFCDLQQHLTT